MRLTSESSQKEERKRAISFIDMEKQPVSMSGMLRWRAQSLVKSFRHDIMTCYFCLGGVGRDVKRDWLICGLFVW
jgi:hypothetical protein